MGMQYGHRYDGMVEDRNFPNDTYFCDKCKQGTMKEFIKSFDLRFDAKVNTYVLDWNGELQGALYFCDKCLKELFKASAI